jgi:hypothetical protein
VTPASLPSDASQLAWSPTTPVGAASFTVTVPAVAGGDVATAEMGAVQNATVNVLVFTDTNRNGIPNAGEAALANRTVRLYTRTGTTILKQVFTGTDGRAALSVSPGVQYRVEVLVPSGWLATNYQARVGQPQKLNLRTLNNAENYSVSFGQVR